MRQRGESLPLPSSLQARTATTTGLAALPACLPPGSCPLPALASELILCPVLLAVSTPEAAEAALLLRLGLPMPQLTAPRDEGC